MKTITTAMFIWMISGNVYANTFYSRGADCEVDSRVEPMVIVASEHRKKGSLSEQSDTEVIALLKKRVYENVQSRLVDFPDGLKFHTIALTKDHVRFKVEVKVMATLPCSDSDSKITEDSLDLMSAIAVEADSKSITLSEFVVTIKPRVQIQKKLSVTNFGVSKLEVFGAKLGMHFNDVEAHFGRFSLVWPVSKTVKVALIGRSHALFFENGKLVGYQLNNELLPVAIKNQLEIVNLETEYQLENGIVQSSQALSKEVESQLEQTFDNVATHLVKVSDNETVSYLAGLTIGVIPKLENIQTLACLDLSNVEDEVEKSADKLIQFTSIDGGLSALSGCRQIVHRSTTRMIRSIELLEPWSLKNTYLLGFDRFTEQQKPWRFYSLIENMDINQLNGLGNVEKHFGLVQFESNDKQWIGSFITEKNQLVSAELQRL